MFERAQELVPGARFMHGDVTSVDDVDFDAASFDEVVSFYAVIHLPLDDERLVPEGNGGHTLFIATRRH